MKSVCESKNFETIFKENSQVLRNYLYYKCGDNDLADDLTQEAFINLWKNCAKVVYEQALFYLKRIATNQFYNVVKHNKVVLNYQNQTKDHVNLESPEFVIEEKEYKIKLEKTIADLPEKQRVVFLLNRIDKKTYKEIAVLLDISVKAVEKRMHLALVSLRKKINGI